MLGSRMSLSIIVGTRFSRCETITSAPTVWTIDRSPLVAFINGYWCDARHAVMTSIASKYRGSSVALPKMSLRRSEPALRTADLVGLRSIFVIAPQLS